MLGSAEDWQLVRESRRLIRQPGTQRGLLWQARIDRLRDPWQMPDHDAYPAMLLLLHLTRVVPEHGESQLEALVAEAVHHAAALAARLRRYEMLDAICRASHPNAPRYRLEPELQRRLMAVAHLRVEMLEEPARSGWLGSALEGLDELRRDGQRLAWSPTPDRDPMSSWLASQWAIALAWALLLDGEVERAQELLAQDATADDSRIGRLIGGKDDDQSRLPADRAVWHAHAARRLAGAHRRAAKSNDDTYAWFDSEAKGWQSLLNGSTSAMPEQLRSLRPGILTGGQVQWTPADGML